MEAEGATAECCAGAITALGLHEDREEASKIGADEIWNYEELVSWSCRILDDIPFAEK